MSDHACAVGIMSGSSLDGVDIVLAQFSVDDIHKQNIPIEFAVLQAETVSIPEALRESLLSLPEGNCMQLSQTERRYSSWIGEVVVDFIHKYSREIEVVGVHGHTVWHHPHEGTSFQLGHGAFIAACSGLPVVSDFRNSDIALGGQGAPMVGLSEQRLWGGYDAYLNLGGICNITLNSNGQYSSQDINICNQLLNYLARQKGSNYDPEGTWAQSGSVIPALLNKWLKQDFFQKTGPKSLDNSFLKQPILEALAPYSDYPIEDQLRTAVEFIAITIHQSFSKLDGSNLQRTILCTGGGAFNTFLVNQINRIDGWNLVLPDRQTIEYKEAIMIAFSALLRMKHFPIFIPEATGASRGAIGGAVYLP